MRTDGLRAQKLHFSSGQVRMMGKYTATFSLCSMKAEINPQTRLENNASFN